MPKTLNLDLNNCFPEPGNPGVPRGPLPKQAQFLQYALDSNSPKYIRYVGGIGSGKSMIGCITVLSWAVTYPGDYLIARQFYPELQDTTYRTFLEICPPELIARHNSSNRVIDIRTTSGKISTIFFRPLEEPDKLRSLNLNGFYIDEANQVSEEAFVLLQGRLRGRHVRKGILTQNSGGHDWSWRWFVKKDMHRNIATKKEFANIVAPSTENTHLPEGYVEMMLSTWSNERIEREIKANEDSFEGAVYPEFRVDTHVVPPFRIPEHWPRFIGSDHGYRNPAVKLWGAVNDEGEVYIYREFYKREWYIEEICNGKKDAITGKRIEPGVKAISSREKIQAEYIDPDVKRQRGSKETPMQEYQQYTPWAIIPANNKKELGIDRVKQFLKIDPKINRPRLFVFSSCENLIDEFQTYKFQELNSGQEGRMNLKEEAVKYHDHAMDALRYLLMSRPEPFVEELDWYKKNNISYNSIQGALHRDFEAAARPSASSKDPFEDGL